MSDTGILYPSSVVNVLSNIFSSSLNVPYFGVNMLSNSLSVNVSPLFSVCFASMSTLASSITCDFAFSSLAFVALLSIPFGPLRADIVTPAKISKTMIVLIFRYDYFFKFSQHFVIYFLLFPYLKY